MRKRLLYVAIGAIIVVVSGSAWLLRPDPVVRTETLERPRFDVSDAQLISQSRIFFAHQSVGTSLIDAMPSIFEEVAVDAPTVRPPDVANDAQPGTLLETAIGTNGDPVGKIKEFDGLLRSGLANTLDAAVLKLCFEDIRGGVDVERVFMEYQQTLSQLQSDFPDVAFIPMTVPLMHERDLVVRAKNVLGRAAEFDPAHNAARHTFNELVRAEYDASNNFIDIARLEAAGKSGRVNVFGSDSGEFLALPRSLATDSGHLTPEGTRVVGRAFFAELARIITEA